ncbi:TetR/AcrR family transcriptional regulator [Conexibacter arvalis]|uniref:AcrR family transcriptional regulator n=1 Tax=Conexibacter arvalis TaxID=912552 RepID=A0A840ICV1_9ACTN|nr:TetR/AcrR family transcriptional regulator [Conexibacter arvalis]MBB4661894.1 AcrR family transcriptional regulator [Conexibacter arvalis]
MTGQRSDFARNERRIVDAAARLLADSPGAGMSEIAAAAGLGRATLYRHFPTREALIAGMREEAYDGVAAVIERHRAAGPAEGGFARLVEELVDVGERYRIVLAGTFDQQRRDETRRRFELPLRELIERAQEAGELDRDVPAQWIGIALGGLLEAAFRAHAEGRVTVSEAKLIAVRGLRSGFGAGRS